MKLSPLPLIAAVVLVALQTGCGRSAQDEPVANQPESTETVVIPPPPRPLTIDFNGYGPARVGMSKAEAEQALGDTIDVGPSPPGASCAYATARHHGGVAFMLIDGRIARVDARADSVRTEEGAGVGDPEQRIYYLYGGYVERQPHHYVDEGHYLIVRPPPGSDDTRRLIFETDGKVVTIFRAGRMPEVEWIEGCS